MNLNQLYFDHQLSLIRADAADGAGPEGGHRREAARIAGRIGERQSALGAPAADDWMRQAAEQAA